MPEGVLVSRGGNAVAKTEITFTTMERKQPEARLYDAVGIDDDFFLFNTHTYRFCNLPQEGAEDDMNRYRTSMSLKEDKPIVWKDAFRTRWKLYADGHLTYQSQDGQSGTCQLDITLGKSSFACTDRQGNLWLLGKYNGIYKLCPDFQRTRRLAIEPKAQVKCLFKDSSQRLWVTTKEDEAVRLYDVNSLKLLGYLGNDGRLHQQYTSFKAAVYSIFEAKDHTLWLHQWTPCRSVRNEDWGLKGRK